MMIVTRVYAEVYLLALCIGIKAFIATYRTLYGRKDLLSRPVRIALYVAITDIDSTLTTGYDCLHQPDDYFAERRDNEYRSTFYNNLTCSRDGGTRVIEAPLE